MLIESALASCAGEPSRITVESLPVQAPQRRGFGSQLLERSLSPGTVHLDFNPDELECRVSLPLGTGP